MKGRLSTACILLGLSLVFWGCSDGYHSSSTRDTRSDDWVLPNQLAEECSFHELVSRFESHYPNADRIRINVLGSEFAFLVRYPNRQNRCSEVFCFEEIEPDRWVLRQIAITRVYDEPELRISTRDGMVQVMQDQFPVFSVAPIKEMFRWQSQSRYVRGGNFQWSMTNKVADPPPMYPRK